MARIFDRVFHLGEGKEMIRQRRYGIITVQDETFVDIRFRPWPKMISSVEANWLGGWRHRQRKNNRCQIFYNQPIGSSGYLALKYIESTSVTSYATIRGALVILDEVARIKNTNAIVCEVTNSRISDRVLARMGFERHLENSRYRHGIRRFYGDFPDHKDEPILNGIVAPPIEIEMLQQN